MHKVVFFGTSEYSVPSLKKLIFDENINVLAVVTKPDQKVSRGQKITETMVSKIANENNIEVLKPIKLKDDIEVINRLKELKPDFFIVISYGQILSKEILDIPKASINAHGSLLPKYRGASPIQTALLDGESTTGVTTMLMDEGLDTGDILLKQELVIDKEDDEESLFNKLSLISADLLTKTINEFDSITSVKQDDSISTKTKLIKKEDAYLDISYDSLKVFNMVRAFKTWPTCNIDYLNDKMKILKVDLVDNNLYSEIENDGKLVNDRLKIYNKKLYLKTNDGFVEIKILKLPGKKEINSRSFINGIK